MGQSAFLWSQHRHKTQQHDSFILYFTLIYVVPRGNYSVLLHRSIVVCSMKAFHRKGLIDLMNILKYWIWKPDWTSKKKKKSNRVWLCLQTGKTSRCSNQKGKNTHLTFKTVLDLIGDNWMSSGKTGSIYKLCRS